MMFQGKLNRVFSKLKENNKEAEQEQYKQEMEEMPLEGKDFLAMMVAAFAAILPVALITLAILAIIGYIFFFH